MSRTYKHGINSGHITVGCRGARGCIVLQVAGKSFATCGNRVAKVKRYDRQTVRKTR